MTETGKAVTTAYYGQSPNYNYFSGCSRGGFQAMTEAQRYPKDYDGIIAAAPGINWPKYGAGRLWGQLSMLLADNFIPACKFDAVTKAAVEACDNIDGVEDNIIGNPRLCQYDPNNFVQNDDDALCTNDVKDTNSRIFVSNVLNPTIDPHHQSSRSEVQ